MAETPNGTLWNATLAPRTASTVPLIVEIVDATGQLLATLDDVLIGTVILVSGQSNVGISVRLASTLCAFAAHRCACATA
jgi:hypothetical protein